MSAREIILLVDDDHAVTEGLAMLLKRAGRTTVICSDVESAELMLARLPVTHLVTDVQFSGAFGFEGLHFMARVRTGVPRCRIVLITGQASPELRASALSSGADAVLEKPFELVELEQAFGITAGPRDDAPYELVRVPAIEEVLGEDALDVVYQPIVSLGADGASLFAYEALARVRGTWPAGNIADFFDYAARRGELARLNLAAIQRALEGTTALPGDATLFINTDPSVFDSKALPRVINAAAASAGLPLDHIVLEITERSAFADAPAVTPLFAQLRASGIRFALDDHGSAYSHLGIMTALAPSFIKISNTFGTDLEEDPARRRIVAHIASLARDFGCRTVVEGVETAATARAAAALGIELAQGYHFGRPNAAPFWQQHELPRHAA